MTPPTLMRRPRFLIVSATTLLLTVALTGCALNKNDDPADDDESVNISPIESAEYVPGSADGPAQHVPTPQLRAVAAENSPQGAVETLLYFWDAIDYGRQTGDTQYAADVAHHMCDLCTTLIYRWEQIYQDNGWAILHDETDLEIYETHGYHDENDDAWIAVLFEMTEPASDFYQDGEFVADESYDAETHEGWWAELRYDEAAQGWEIRWIDFDDAMADRAPLRSPAS